MNDEMCEDCWDSRRTEEGLCCSRAAYERCGNLDFCPRTLDDIDLFDDEALA